MPVSRGSPTPVIVEVRPSSASADHPKDASTTTFSELPSPPSTPTTPKSVRFARPSAGLVRSTRLPTNTEGWAVYLFETHAQNCSSCQDPLTRHARGERLCPVGHGLAYDVVQHFEYVSHDIYSVHVDARQQRERVELHPNYRIVRALLQSIAQAKQSPRTPVAPPVITYDHHNSYDDNARHRHAATVPVIISTPSSSSSRHHHHQTSTAAKTKHRSTRYRAIVVNDSPDRVVLEPLTPPGTPDPSSSSTRRGSLYESDQRRARERERERDREKGYRGERLPQGTSSASASALRRGEGRWQMMRP